VAGLVDRLQRRDVLGQAIGCRVELMATVAAVHKFR
jgi:hypothetical protein